MQKISVLTAVIFLFTPSALWAREGKYLAVGVSYNLENHKVGGYDFDGNAAFNVKLGYTINNNITLEGNIDNTSFEHDGAPWDNNHDYSSLPSFDVTTIIFDVKLSPDFRSPLFQPYAVFGFGMMISDPAKHTASPSWNYSLNEAADKEDVRYLQRVANLNNSAICGEIGVGFDYYFADALSLQAEMKYVLGFEDLEDVQYLKSTLGFAFHF